MVEETVNLSCYKYTHIPLTVNKTPKMAPKSRNDRELHGRKKQQSIESENIDVSESCRDEVVI